MTPSSDASDAGSGHTGAAAQAVHAQRDDWLAELMHRVARSDRDAFAQLYRATSATLFGFVLRINRDRALAEDVLQEIYLSVWRQAAAFDRDQGQAMAWLTAIARHRAIDSMRRKAAQPVTISRFGGLEGYAGDPASHEPDLLAGLPSDTPGPLQLLDDASRAHALAHCMDRLSGEQRSSLALAYYQGLSHAEVAEHMSQPLGTVKSWVRRGLQSLRSCLDRATERLGAFGKAS